MACPPVVPAANLPQSRSPGTSYPTARPPVVPAANLPQSTQDFDICAVLDNAVKLRREKLDWRQSIVDLMKVLRVDPSKESRKKLALAVGYNGDPEDSWTMNIWLSSYVKEVVVLVGGDLAAARDVLLKRSNQANSVPNQFMSAKGIASLPQESVDISTVLDNVVKLRCQDLDWRHSIVDFMKTLRLDPSKEARKRLALGVGYDGDMDDSATTNIWLLSYVKDVIATAGGDLTAARGVLLAKMS